MPRNEPARLFVDGTWIDGAEVTDIRNPYDQSVVGRCHRAGAAQIEQALAAADRAFRTHRNDAPHVRAAALGAMAEILGRRADELARTISAEAGKPIHLARAEVERSRHTLGWSAEEAKRIGGEVLPLDVVPVGGDHMGLTRRFPVGPILAISPFNFPLNLVCHKVGPALAAGCSIVLRPASQTPLTALLLAEAAQEAGLPAGLLNVVPCAVPLAEAMIVDPRIQMVTFTGSPAVGWPLKQKAGRRKVVLELGGNAAVILDQGVDLDPLLPRLASGAFGYAGQSCISIQRIFVHRSAEAAFLEKLASTTRESVPFGDPADERTISGPMIHPSEADRVMSWIEEARARGARVWVGGDRKGNVIAPTLLSGVDPKLPISCQEVFGPVAVIDGFDTFEEAIAKVNDSRFGLQAGVFTHDLDHAFRAFRDLEVGGVAVNEVPTYRVDHMPYGGVKESGFGREGVRYAIEEMTELKLMLLRLEP